MRDAADLPLVTPGRSAGLVDVLRQRYLLKLLVGKELRVRYRGSVLGLLWSYVKPAFQLLVFYIALGKFLGLARAQPNYLVYLFSGIVMVGFFSEVFANATRSVVNNGDLVKKIYLPRELFPVSSVWVAIVHLVPQVLVLVLVGLTNGWRPGPMNLLACVMAILVVGLTGLGLGLMFGAWNVLFRDAENFVELILMAATWMSPVLYQWQKVADVLPSWLFKIYQANPLSGAVELAHFGFWAPSAKVHQVYPGTYEMMPPHFWVWSLISLAGSVVLMLVGQLEFKRLEGRFAQEL